MQDDDFSNFIRNLVGRFSNVLSENTLRILFADMPIFRQAFTVDDYEIFEQMGDAVISQFIINYSYRRFPFLRSKDGVKIVARIRIKYTSRAFLSDLAETLGFWPQIAGVEVAANVTRRLSLLEDVFEAFIGAINYIIDHKVGPGAGYIASSAILTAIYESRDIDITYESLFDAKTRLKELCDFFKQRLTVTWASDKNLDTIKVRLICSIDGNKQTIHACARTKVDAEQQAAQQVINILDQIGIKKARPEIFTQIQAAYASSQ